MDAKKLLAATAVRMFGFAMLAASVAHIAPAQAAFYDRGNGMIYDSSLNITWLQDANYSSTSKYDSDGVMTWAQATNWANNLAYSGFSDWRLASARLISPGSPCSAANGSCDLGYNNTFSEIGHLFTELGNIAFSDWDGNYPPDFGFIHTTFYDSSTNKLVSFLNVKNYLYWEAESGPYDSANAWIFRTSVGSQEYQFKIQSGYAWAVRDGDVAAVPLPAAAWLFGTSLIGIATAARRRKQQTSQQPKHYA